MGIVFIGYKAIVKRGYNKKLSKRYMTNILRNYKIIEYFNLQIIQGYKKCNISSMEAPIFMKFVKLKFIR